MLRKSKYMVCAAAVGLAGILGAFSLASACDKCATGNDDTTNISKAEPPAPGPALTKVRNYKAPQRTPRGTANPTVLAKRARALLNSKCVRCHGANRQESGLDLSSRQSLLTGGDSGPSVVPGQPDKSLILQRVRAGEMPPSNVGQLSPQEIATLQQWIAAGAP